MDDLQQNSAPLNRLFSDARAEADRETSVLPEVNHRLAGASMDARRSGSWGILVGLVVVLLLGSVGWWVGTAPSRSFVSVARSSRAAEPQAASVTVNHVELVQHLAAMIDGRVVVVVWSCRGDGFSPQLAMPSSERYRARVLRQTDTKDGRVLTCAIFVAADGVRPILQPPTLRAVSSTGKFLAFSAAPTACSREQLAAELHACPIDASSIGAIVADIQHHLQ